jgi:hypothetical protein
VHEVLTRFLCVDILQPCESLGLGEWNGFGRLIGQLANGIEQSDLFEWQAKDPCSIKIPIPFALVWY